MFGKVRIIDPYNTMGDHQVKTSKEAKASKKAKTGKPGRRTHWDQMPLSEVRDWASESGQLEENWKREADALRSGNAAPGEWRRFQEEADRAENALRDKYRYDGLWRC